MVRQVPNNPTFRLVRNIYIAILDSDCIAVLLYLIGAVLCGVAFKGIDNVKPQPGQPQPSLEDKEQVKFVFKVAVALLSILFVFGLVKQVLLRVILKYNTCCIMAVIVIDILSLFIINFGAFFTGYSGFGVFGFIVYGFDLCCLSYMYIQIRQYDIPYHDIRFSRVKC